MIVNCDDSSQKEEKKTKSFDVIGRVVVAFMRKIIETNQSSSSSKNPKSIPATECSFILFLASMKLNSHYSQNGIKSFKL